MSYNTFGRLFRFTTWGESHGAAIGCVVDGVPPGLPLTEADIQPFLDARAPGGSKYVTQRKEPDQVKILSGVFEDENTDGQVTTGAPISLIIENVDQRSKDYSEIAQQYRPGHADFTYDAKYGVRDYRGGGRSSARETAMRVAAGAIARKILGPEVGIRAALVSIGGDEVDRAAWHWDVCGQNPFWCPDPAAAERWASQLDEVRKAGSSVGAVIEAHAEGVPAGWGAPVYAKLDADLAGAMMSINAAKGVEIGSGFALGAMRGEDAADEMRAQESGGANAFAPQFLSNHNGGVLGGISSGQPVVVRVAIKPTSSILTPKQSVSRSGENVETRTKGRHDPCVGIRGAPVAEAMLACVLADHFLLHRAQTGREGPIWRSS
ncbi:MAG: chorismate synthase [Maricaulaceae bacterium]|jgi:chorismate synthase